ncbi:MAG: hypothetical protein PHE24_00200 [Patescibacteria group bacterium]|nr:hypothetical protein [Patescibacteria group bacterium]
MISPETVFDYCVRKLTEQIRECTFKPRLPDSEGIVDEAIAKAYLKLREAAVVGPIYKALRDKNPDEYGYHEFDRDYGKYIWDKGYQWVKGIIGEEPLYVIHFR